MEQPQLVDVPASLEVALDAELHRFDLLVLRLWQILGVSGIVFGLAYAFFVAFDLGIACSVTAAIYTAWMIPVAWRVERAPHDRWLRVTTPVIEATFPWTFLIVMAVVEGADYALASWVPPMLFAFVLVSYMLRLKVRATIGVGLASAAFLLLAYHIDVAARLTDDQAAMLINQPAVQSSRALAMAFAGLVAALGVRFLRRAIVRAGRVVREHELFGKYKMRRKIARGGMAEVWEALYCPEGGFERPVAVKRIHPHLVEQERFVNLFRAEAAIGSRLAHPNIVQVMDFGRIDESYFLTMEFIDGITLAQLISRAHSRKVVIPERVVGQIMRDLLAGLDYAHERVRGADGQRLHVIHRDLCPQNVLLSRNGEVKISDFGVARALRDADSSHTQNVEGHVGYMAPEQARAQSFDQRVDLFAVGVTLWELLSGRRLFARGSAAATLQALLNDPVLDVTTLEPSLDPGWDRLLRRALERDPEGRFQSAQQMSSALDEITTSQGPRTDQELAQLVELLSAGPEELLSETAPTRVDRNESAGTQG